MRKITIIFQHDSMQCGIACLQMVCKYFGREYSLDSLSKLCFATTEGVSMLGINEAANTLGLHTISARVTTAQWKFSGDKHKSLQVYTERTFHQRYLLVML